MVSPVLGLMTELTGPMLTAFNVVFGSQSARNRQEIRWLGQVWQQRQGVTARHFVFYLSQGPLSWHLSEQERGEILAHWPTTDDPTLEGFQPKPVSQEEDSEEIDPVEEKKQARFDAREFNRHQLERLVKFMNGAE